MPSIPVGYEEVTLIWRAVGAVRDQTCTFGIDNGFLPAEAPSLTASNIHTLITAVGRPCNAAQMSNGWTFQGVSVTLQLEDGPLVGQFRSTVTGTVVQSPVPINTSLLLTKNTSAGGRRNRGRMFVPPANVNEANVDQLGTYAGAAGQQTLWNAFQTAMATADYQYVLFHNAAPFTPTPVNSFTVQSLLATQRRRMRK